jgi:hypothetical protein
VSQISERLAPIFLRWLLKRILSYASRNMKPFSAKVLIVGINPYVYLPEPVLSAIFKQAQRNSYLNHLKSEAAVARTVEKVLRQLAG